MVLILEGGSVLSCYDECPKVRTENQMPWHQMRYLAQARFQTNSD